MNFTTNAINLKSYNLSESDKIIVMYSQDKGLIKCVAKGAKKSNSKLGGRLDMFVANKLLLYKGKNLDKICQAEALNTFNKTRTNYDKLLYSSYLAEIINNFCTENDANSEDIYQLFYLALEHISNAKNKTEVLIYTIKFQLKIMKLLGYEMTFDRCIHCNKEIGDKNSYFDINQGGSLCEECSNNAKNTIRINYKIKNYLVTEAKEEFSTQTKYDTLMTENVAEICFKFLNKYIQNNSNRQFNTEKILETL